MYDLQLEELLDMDSVGIYTMDDNGLYRAKEVLDDIVSRELETSDEMLERVNYTRDVIDVELIARGLI